MKSLKARNIVSLVLNVVALALIVSGMVYSFGSPGCPLKTLYMNVGYLTNVLLGVFLIIGIIFNIVRLAKKQQIQCGFIYSFQLMLTVLAFAVVLFNIFYVKPNSAAANFGQQCMVCSFYYTPAVLFIVTFLFFETEKVRNWAYSLVAPILFVVYSCSLILCCSMGWLKAIPNYEYYEFFNISKWFVGTDWWRAVIMLVVIIIGGFGVGFGFLAINHGMSKKSNPVQNEVKVEVIPDGQTEAPVAETPVVEAPVEKAKVEEAAPAVEEEPIPEEEIQVEEEPKVAPAKKKSVAKKPVAKKAEKKEAPKAKPAPKKVENKKAEKKPAPKAKSVPEEKSEEPRVYHISKRSDNHMWQVKFANGKKAIKFFKTQAEAVEYAKQLTETQGGSIRVHSLKGKIKKSS